MLLSKRPWDLEPDLTQDRLIWLARNFAEVRREARTTHEPSKGDGAWGLGTKCYERQCFTLIAAAGTGEQPWLRIIDPSLEFIFAIGSVPARVYRGSPESPRPNVREGLARLRQIPLFSVDDPKTFAWCFAIETDDAMLVERVTLAGFSPGGELIYWYPIPFDAAAESLTPIVPIVPPPVPIPPPAVLAPTAKKKKVSDDDEEE
jgi:hypothetical protein